MFIYSILPNTVNNARNSYTDGSYTYTLDESKTALQALAEGQTDNEHPVYYTVNNTTELTSNLIVRVKGTNDAATITGTDTGSVDEDTASTATGTLLADDVDNTDNAFQANSGNAAYGSFAIDADGNWTYTLDDTNADVDALNDDDSLSDSFVVKSEDGTEHTVSVTITGTNDAATITGTDSGSVDEDTSSIAAGLLLADDVDNTDNAFQANSGNAAYGSFAIDADGNWTYTLDDTNADVDALNDDGSLSDSFVVKSADGTEHTVSVTITGTTDALPPADGGGGGSGGGTTTPTPETIIVNNGVSFQNGKYHVVTYDTGDILSVSGYSYNGNYTLIDAFGNDGIIDSVSAHFVKTGGGSGGQTGNGDVDVILDHYMDDFVVVIGSNTTNVDVVI